MISSNGYRKWIFLALATLVLVSCERALFRQSHEIPNKKWERSHTIKFNVEVRDTMSGYDFYIDLRNAGTYPYSNIFMFVNTNFPSGKTARDTVECVLADLSGRWLGDGLGDILDNRILFKQNIRFPNSGTYTFEFEQGMRMTELSDILDVGIFICPHKKK